MTLLHDSMHFTPEGRRLLAALGAIEPDPLRVQAEQWLTTHKGCQTPATRRVREALGPPVPADWIRSAQIARGAK